MSIEKLFPVSGEAKLQERLIIINEYTRRFVPGHFADMFMFGTIDDMLLFWNQPKSPMDKRGSFMLLSEISPENCAEVFLGTNFASMIGLDAPLDLQGYYHLLRQYFCIVDAYSLDLYWFHRVKFIRGNELHNRDRYSGEMCLEHSDWLSMYLHDHEEISIPEEKKKQVFAKEVVL